MSVKKKTKLLAVVGPTASGKSGLAVELAKKYNGEIVSCDSMQIYKEISVSTAKPTIDEMQGIPHYLLDHVSINENYNVVRYVEEATKKIEEIATNGKLPLLCGGTGMYYTSLVDSVKFSENSSNVNIREKYSQYYEENGGTALLEKLRQIDEETANKLHEKDKSRIIRALEVFETTGVTFSEHVKRSKNGDLPYDLCAIGLNFADRSDLYSRIEKRIDLMVKNGIVEEARTIMREANPQSTVYQAIGIKEFFPYIKGDSSLDDCVDLLKKETRHYAKRQLTWFRRDERINWIVIEKDETLENIFKKACEIVEKTYLL